MLLTELYYALSRLGGVQVEADADSYRITNRLQGYSAKVHFDEIEGFKPIVSPGGDAGIQIFYRYEGGLVVTAQDYMFDIQQGPFYTVPNLPPIFTLSLLIDSFLDYRQNPSPSTAEEVNVSVYFTLKYIIDSAEAKGFDMSAIRSEMQQIRTHMRHGETCASIEYGSHHFSEA